MVVSSMSYNDSRHPVFVSTMSSDCFEVYHSLIPVETGLRLHTHDYYEINCVLEGSGEFQIDSQLIPVSAGSILLINPGVVHNIVRQTTPRYERVYIHINPSFLVNCSTEQTPLDGCFYNIKGNTINRTMHMDPDMLRELIVPMLKPPSRSFGDDLRYRHFFMSAMIRFNEQAQADDASQTLLPEPSFRYSPIITKALHYIDEHLSDELTLENIADQCAVNKYYFARQFKKEIGQTPGHFILSRRLQSSKRLLAQIGSSKMIYRTCGFKSYTHFLRAFQQEFGMTPRQYVVWSHTSHATGEQI